MASHARKSRRSAHNKFRRVPRSGIVAIVIGAILGACCIAGVATAAIWLQDLPDYTDASAYNYSEKTRIYASDGETLLGELYLENRDPITSLEETSDYVTKGTVATEDERFYSHMGVDLEGIARAVVVNVTGSGHEGASTITQQFVRNTILADEATESSLKRKVREAFIAINLEKMYSKDDILLMYLNTIYYGQGAYGIEAASQLYYSKASKDLTIAEAATLIGIPQSPTYNNPVDNPENCISRRNVVLQRMLSNNVITQAEYDEAVAQELNLNVDNSANENNGLYQYKYFTSYVRDTLLEDYSTEQVFQGGLKVITTLDVQAQQQAEAAAEAQYNRMASNLEVALVAVDPDTGFIRALVGGKDYDTDQYNLATQAKRQPGSSFKTFTLLAALNDGVSPQTNLNCTSTVKFKEWNWTVSNINKINYGTRTVASAFEVSSNTGFAQLITEIGADKVVDMAHTCGIEEDLEAIPALTLGVKEVTVREMAQAYATIANGGTKREAVCIERIEDSSGATIYTADTTGEKVLDTALTQAATEVMKGVVTNGTAKQAQLGSQEVAGKTGTSENMRDKWFCGITPQLSVAVWVGGRDEVKMNSSIHCASVFHDFMTAYLQGRDTEKFPTSSTKLEYTTTDFGNGSGSTLTDAPENEGEETTTTTTTTTETTAPTTDSSTTGGADTGGNTGGNTGTDTGGGGTSGGGDSGGGDSGGGDSGGGDTGGGGTSGGGGTTG